MHAHTEAWVRSCKFYVSMCGLPQHCRRTWRSAVGFRREKKSRAARCGHVYRCAVALRVRESYKVAVCRGSGGAHFCDKSWHGAPVRVPAATRPSRLDPYIVSCTTHACARAAATSGHLSTLPTQPTAHGHTLDHGGTVTSGRGTAMSVSSAHSSASSTMLASRELVWRSKRTLRTAPVSVSERTYCKRGVSIISI